MIFVGFNLFPFHHISFSIQRLQASHPIGTHKDEKIEEKWKKTKKNQRKRRKHGKSIKGKTFPPIDDHFFFFIIFFRDLWERRALEKD